MLFFFFSLLLLCTVLPVNLIHFVNREIHWLICKVKFGLPYMQFPIYCINKWESVQINTFSAPEILFWSFSLGPSSMQVFHQFEELKKYMLFFPILKVLFWHIFWIPYTVLDLLKYQCELIISSCLFWFLFWVFSPSKKKKKTLFIDSFLIALIIKKCNWEKCCLFPAFIKATTTAKRNASQGNLPLKC